MSRCDTVQNKYNLDVRKRRVTMYTLYCPNKTEFLEF